MDEDRSTEKKESEQKLIELGIYFTKLKKQTSSQSRFLSHVYVRNPSRLTFFNFFYVYKIPSIMENYITHRFSSFIFLLICIHPTFSEEAVKKGNKTTSTYFMLCSLSDEEMDKCAS